MTAQHARTHTTCLQPYVRARTHAYLPAASMHTYRFEPRAQGLAMTFPTGIEVSRQNLGLGAVKSGELLRRSQGMVGLAIHVVALYVA